MCGDDLVDFRGKLPRRVHSILFAKSQATGRDRQVLVREVMQQWADDELHAANVMQRVLRSGGVAGECRGSRRGIERERGLMRLIDTSPELGLWFAVLEHAASDFRDGSGTVVRGSQHFSAAAWFADERTHVGSFLWVCSMLGVDPERFRAHLRDPRLRDAMRSASWSLRGGEAA